jgi:hypothetical protein
MALRCRERAPSTTSKAAVSKRSTAAPISITSSALGRNSEIERFGGLEVDRQLEFEIGGFDSRQDAIVRLGPGRAVVSGT